MSSEAVNISSPREDVALVEFVGEHDLSSKDETTKLLGRLVGENGIVVVDLCSATFIDSSFLSCLLIADRKAQECGHELRLHVCDAPNISSVLSVSGIAERLTIVTTHADAIAQPVD